MTDAAESYNIELNLLAAIVKYDGLQLAQRAGVTSDSFIDMGYAQAFDEVARHAAKYGRLPSWGNLRADFLGFSNTTQPATPQPLAYYLDVFHERARYNILAEAISEGAEILDLGGGSAEVIERAAARLRMAIEDLLGPRSGGGGLDELVRGSDLLALPDPPVEWLVEGIWVRGSYGMIGAPEKSLKSYVTLELCLAVASGAPFLGRYDVPQRQPVLAYVGEGGRREYHRRLKRVAHGMELEERDLMDRLYLDFEAGPLNTDEALSRLSGLVQQSQAGLVVIDPLYRFHGGTSNAANLYEQGAFLSELSHAVGDAALLIVHHFNQTGGGKATLKRLSMAGGAEWSDSWMLVTKEVEAVAAGSFQLKLEVGSRQWGGRTIHVAAELGQLDEVTHQHRGEVSLRALDADAVAAAASEADDEDETWKEQALKLVRDHPFDYTKTDLALAMGGNKKRALTLVGELIADGRIQSKSLPGKPRRAMLSAP